ncbi:MAG: ABC transporter permease, partial [Oscillospiraceae bacterium]
GPILNNHPWPLYLTFFIIIPLVYIVLYKTQFGLRLRATGFEPKAADSVGIKSDLYRFNAILICGFLCGLGGSYLSIGYMRMFSENMSSGRGWIAIAIILLTKGHPFKILVLGLIFGFCEGLGMSLQIYNIPTQFTYMLPYVATLIALFLDSRNAKITDKLKRENK